MVILTTLDRLSCFLDGCFLGQKLQQSSRGRNWMSEHFLATISCHQHSTLASQACEVSTSSEIYPNMRLFFLSFECLDIQFFNSHSHVTYRMPCYARGHSYSCLGKHRISLGVAIILRSAFAHILSLIVTNLP